MLVVCGIIFAVTFVERLPANATAIEAVSESWMRLLEYVPLFLPLAVFMGTLLASYNLTKSSESIIVSSAGLSPYQSARPFLVGAALIGIFATTVINPYAVNLSTQNITAHNLKLVDNKIWLREASNTGFITMTASTMHKLPNGLAFENATVYTQNPDFKLTARVQAPSIELTDIGLSATDATILSGDGTTHHGPWAAQTRLTPQTVLDRYLQPDQISFWQLPHFIIKMNDIGVPMRGHLVQFWTLLFLPLTMIAMATLGVAFSQTRQRRNFNFGLKFGLGIITCFAVYFLVNMFSALGSTGVLPPLLAIVAPPLIIIACAGTFIASFDTI
ncbi:MAG: LptF/LptG family permease [Muribaculaceae bacterium]|nr:LptF/LptG family permease [Muribaculaceae bacterium]